MRKVIVLSALALAACGSPEGETAKAPEAASPSAAAATQTAPSPTAKPSASLARDGEVDCSGYPAYVALPSDVVIDGCFISQAGPGFGNGTLIYETPMSAEDIVAFYRGKARSSGLADGPAPGPGGYAAQDGAKRTIKVVTRPGQNGGVRVTLNWTQDE